MSKKQDKVPKRKSRRGILYLFLLIFIIAAFMQFKGFFPSFPSLSTGAVISISDNEEPEEITFDMGFSDGNLYLANTTCKDLDDLEKVLEKIRKKHPKDKIQINYTEGHNDPFILAQKAQEIVQEKGFILSVTKLLGKENSGNGK